VIYAYWVSDPSSYGVVEFDAGDRPIGIVEKPKQPRSNWAVTGLHSTVPTSATSPPRYPRSARASRDHRHQRAVH
jgi:glucose-1-phosphate thymidylyltransferase